MHESGRLVKRDRGLEPAVALEEELPRRERAVLGNHGLEEPPADAEPLVAGGHSHLRELVTPLAGIQQGAGADDLIPITREEDSAARAQDLERLREHLLIDGLHSKIPLEPFDVEPLEVTGIALLERDDLHAAMILETREDAGCKAVGRQRPVDCREMLRERVVRLELGHGGDYRLPYRLQPGHDAAAMRGKREQAASVVFRIGRLLHHTMTQELTAHLTHRGVGLAQFLRELR